MEARNKNIRQKIETESPTQKRREDPAPFIFPLGKCRVNTEGHEDERYVLLYQDRHQHRDEKRKKPFPDKKIEQGRPQDGKQTFEVELIEDGKDVRRIKKKSSTIKMLAPSPARSRPIRYRKYPRPRRRTRPSGKQASADVAQARRSEDTTGRSLNGSPKKPDQAPGHTRSHGDQIHIAWLK